MPQHPFVPVIPAGGAGTRLWPLSRRSRPKFLLDLTGEGRSLLQSTVERLTPLADGPPIVVTGAVHEAAVREQLDGSDAVRVLAEPSPRNSMPAIALAAALVEREQPEAIIGSFAADHLIDDHEALARAVVLARDAAERGYLVTLGVTPTYPATGFGYIEQIDHRMRGTQGPQEGRDSADGRLGGPARPGALPPGAHPVARFVEKPDRERAEQFLSTGRFLWNAGMFVVRASLLLDELAVQIPSLAAGAREIAAAAGTERYPTVLERIWPRLTAIAIDHALAEPLAADGRVAVVPAVFGWDDVGDFAALARQLREHPVRAVGEGGGSAAEDGEGGDVRVLGSATVDAVSSCATVYGSTDRHIALVGLDGISIVDTEDALLVLADEQAQDLSVLVARLEQRGLGRLR